MGNYDLLMTSLILNLKSEGLDELSVFLRFRDIRGNYVLIMTSLVLNLDFKGVTISLDVLSGFASEVINS